VSAGIHALVVTALPAEARPLIDCWGMHRDSASRVFPVYHAQHNGEKISLIVSGIGKINAAAGCAHLYNLCTPPNALWLNAGIAGHAERDRGDAFIAHSIEDSTTGKRWCPPMLFKPGCPSEHLISVDKIIEPYPNNAAVDMEASAFFAIATRYSTAELVQSVKVVSDNSRQGVNQITAANASLWMGDAVDLFQQTISQLRELAAHLPSSKLHETA
jgi:adenosylhomocysteine nucleosidase